MFENLLYQNRIKSRLITDIQGGCLPQSLLFCGPEFAGKNTAALELVRVINCQKPGAPWDCRCSSCQSQRLLIHPDTLFLGRSHFIPDIQASLDLLTRRDAPSSRFMLIRNIRKILRRFDGVLWEGDEKKISKASKALDELSQLVLDINPGQPLPENLSKWADEMIKQAMALEKMIPMTVPINQIRRVNHWSHLASQGQNVKKVMIIDRAEQMQESSRNSLLKLLEEPPRDVYLILLTSKKKRILPTILSRLRCYDFAARDKEASHGVQTRIFRSEETMDSMRLFFRQFSASENDGQKARLFLMSIYEGAKLFPANDFAGMSKEEIPQFFLELMDQLQEWLHFYDDAKYPTLSLSVFERWNKSIRQSYRSMESLNLSGMLLLEDLFYQLRNQL